MLAVEETLLLKFFSQFLFYHQKLFWVEKKIQVYVIGWGGKKYRNTINV